MGVENWPVGPDGQPEKAVLLDCEADFAAFGGITLSKLEAFGIPVFTNRPDLGEMSFLYGGSSITGIQFFVPESRLQEAKELLVPAEDAE